MYTLPYSSSNTQLVFQLLRPLLPTLILLGLSYTGYSQSRHVRQLGEHLDRIESYLDRRDALAPEVSAVPVAWHLDHMLKMVTAIHSVLKSSDPADYSYQIKPMRTLVFTMGRFPRGVAESPSSVRPPDIILTAAIREQLAGARALLPTFSALQKQQFFDHFVFGSLNRRRTVKFINIHTRHHLRIIDDILKVVAKQEE